MFTIEIGLIAIMLLLAGLVLGWMAIVRVTKVPHKPFLYFLGVSGILALLAQAWELAQL